MNLLFYSCISLALIKGFNDAVRVIQESRVTIEHEGKVHKGW